MFWRSANNVLDMSSGGNKEMGMSLREYQISSHCEAAIDHAHCGEHSSCPNMNATNEVSWVSSLVYPMAHATHNGLSLGAGKERQYDDRVVRVQLIL
jgi:hypothetical protein